MVLLQCDNSQISLQHIHVSLESLGHKLWSDKSVCLSVCVCVWGVGGVIKWRIVCVQGDSCSGNSLVVSSAAIDLFSSPDSCVFSGRRPCEQYLQIWITLLRMSHIIPNMFVFFFPDILQSSWNRSRSPKPTNAIFKTAFCVKVPVAAVNPGLFSYKREKTFV